ncbi:MAG: fibrobacter succinogenes major paralogous domain-containing protein, partial [Paludibacteraceae bacterium]|nr:fibrobacter succinogenes major paralogous domain-containing protein [Paludibacteraceae bacterium]
WAAAVGVADGEEQTTEFSGNRQGICPNGWHVPSRAEWRTLYDYIYSAQKLTSDAVGKHLKTTSGWYSGNSYYKPGLDTYGFAALPVGRADGSSVYNVGYITNFWTATPNESYSYYAYNSYLGYGYDYLSDVYNGGKNYGLSVRCLRD